MPSSKPPGCFCFWNIMGSGSSKPKRGPVFASLAKKSLSSQDAEAPQSRASPSSPLKATAKPLATKEALGHVAWENGQYRGAPLPSNEIQRMECLCGLGVLDTPADKRFDDITRLACLIFKVPIALVSLVDKDRQWFKSVQGLDTDHTERQSSFCAWTLLPDCPEVLVVKDATKDARFQNNPLVTGPPDIRFYAGAPLVTSNDLRLGSLCIIDRSPREFDAESCMMLANLASMAVREIEKEKMLEEQKQVSAALSQENTQLLRAIDAFSEGIILCNVSEPAWSVEFINEAWEQITGFSKEQLGNGFWSFFRVADKDSQAVQAEYRQAVLEQKPFDLCVYFLDARQQPKYLTLNMRCANLENLDDYMPLIGIPSILSDKPEDGTAAPTYYFATLTQQRISDEPVALGTLRISQSGSLVTGSATRSTPTGPNSSGGKTAFQLVETNKDPFGDVKLGQLLGRGSYGRVYRGRWNGAQVAVKILEYEQSEAMGKELMEALLCTQLSHPNVVQTYKHCTREMGCESKVLNETWMVMEFCNKGSLADAIDKGSFRRHDNMFECDYAALVATAKEIASACCYLHNHNITHADLNCNNILLCASQKDTRQFIIKVCDFGLSRVLESQDRIQTATLGTITHMPPELVLDGILSKPADVYAFGIIMWEMFMGQRPWMGLSHSQIIHAISTGKQLQLGSGCPTVLRTFIQKCTAAKPESRPSFTEVLPMLDDLEDELVGMLGDS